MLSHEAIILQRGLKDGTATHESLHCLGIPHSFSERNVLFFEIAFKRNYTDNIMDYSDMYGIPTIDNMGISMVCHSKIYTCFTYWKMVKFFFINNLHATDSMCTSYPKREYDKKKQ